MRKYKYYLIVFTLPLLAAISSCRKPDPIPGPRGPQGPQGEMGPGAFMWEIGPLNFIQNNEYSNHFFYDVEMFNTDKVLVYLLWDDEDIDIWRPLPVSVFIDGGTLQYDYDFTMEDTRIFMHATHSVLLQRQEFTLDNFFRVVVIPAGFIRTAGVEDINWKDYNEVMNTFKPKMINPPLKK